MIRKSKKNENKPDFDVMFNEVQEEVVFLNSNN